MLNQTYCTDRTTSVLRPICFVCHGFLWIILVKNLLEDSQVE